MSLVKVHCKTCGEDSKIDIADWSKEKVEEWLKKDDGFHCFGHHVEFGSRDRHWILDWDNIEEGSAPTEEQFISDLKSKYSEIYNTDELQKFYIVSHFSGGLCFTQNKETNEYKTFDFAHSPKGMRYYYSN